MKQKNLSNNEFNKLIKTQYTNIAMNKHTDRWKLSAAPYFCQYLHCTDLEVHPGAIITPNNTTIPRYNFSDEIDYTFGSHDFIIFFPTVEKWLILHVCIARARPTNQTQIKNLPCKTCLNSVQIRLKLRWTSTGGPFYVQHSWGSPFLV